MKIVTWNLPYSFYAGVHEEAWEYCLNQIDADYYLIQEASPPDWVFDEWNGVWSEISESRSWGSGIFSRKHDLREVDIDSDFRGSMMAADSAYMGEFDVTLISLYGLFERLGNKEFVTPNLHRMLSDLTGIFTGRTHDSKNVILGGDFNASKQIDEIYNVKTHGVFFDRLEAFGLSNCFEPFYDDYVQTHRHKRSNRAWQNDYLFVSNGLATDLRSCEVLENDQIRKFSDHNPVIITLDV